MKRETYKILVAGQVQGVGFRPYVYTLANSFKLRGTVSNSIEGVVILVNGKESAIRDFYRELIQHPPPVSKIKSSSILLIEPREFDGFKIVASDSQGQVNLPLTPDFAICEACKKELNSKDNRRFGYAFTTCVNCGPRWSITEQFPFERMHTSINAFSMCSACNAEYTDPSNRRFHSQTNTCPECGISFEFVNKDNELVPSENIFKTIAELLEEGKIVAVKNTSGYLLCCHAENRSVVETLRKRKNRPTKPFAVLFPSLEILESELSLNEMEVQSLKSTERPITIVPLSNYNGKLALDAVAPGLRQLGVMLPYTGILQLLANELDFPIVATSGNMHGSPIISEATDAFKKLHEVADYFLHHKLNINHPQDDSVLKISPRFKQPVLFRRSRGYAPNYLEFECKTTQKILALGADLKNSIAFAPNAHLYLGQYIGNLENFDVYQRFTWEIDGFFKIFQQQPSVILMDAHPNYQSSRYGVELAKMYGLQPVRIQHHKAHFAAALGEHQLFDSGKVMGVVWDGTGYGDDGAIWGGEFFKYEKQHMERLTHFEYFDWISGDKMSKEPRLSLFSLMDEPSAEVQSKFSKTELQVLKTLKGGNKLKTSSVGRLFDAVSSLLEICDFNSYEGEAAILLENAVDGFKLDKFTSYIGNYSGGSIPTKEILEGVRREKAAGVEKQQIIGNFLNTLATLVFRVAEYQGITKICFSGGVFQNTTLLDLLMAQNTNNFELFFHRNVPPNDENIAFGQLMYHLNCRKQ